MELGTCGPPPLIDTGIPARLIGMAAERFALARLVVHGSPFLGVLAWIGAMNLPGQGWNFALLFAPGLFMLAAGLAAALAGRYWGTGAWLAAAQIELWFQGRVGLVFLILVLIGMAFIGLGTPRPGGQPPESFDAVISVLAFLGAFLLPLLEAGHALFILLSAPG